MWFDFIFSCLFMQIGLQGNSHWSSSLNKTGGFIIYLDETCFYSAPIVGHAFILLRCTWLVTTCMLKDVQPEVTQGCQWYWFLGHNAMNLNVQLFILSDSYIFRTFDLGSITWRCDILSDITQRYFCPCKIMGDANCELEWLFRIGSNIRVAYIA